jgi:alkanesulfonate monooxygenase SsuD/methylene tetrahydromethanopterin reductase-like flavin-dependent oxidoreductase (luciferase family)
MKSRLAKLNPPPVGDLPILIGGGGEKVTLRLVAEYADAWNTFGPPENFAKKSAILDEWCEKVGRNPSEIERTVAVGEDDVEDIGRYVDAGASHVIVMVGNPYPMAPLERLIAQRDRVG